MIQKSNFYKKLKRQYINLSLIKAASLRDYLVRSLPFCLFYFLGRGKAAFPLNITLDLTYECNLDCKFCFLHFLGQDNLIKNEPYLTYGEIEKIVFSLRRKKTSFFLTGGEPTLRKDLIDIVKLIKENRFKCGIFTNAVSLGPAISEGLLKLNIDYLFFSLDGPRDIHDGLRGQGRFEKTYSNIAHIAKRRSKSRPKIIMNVLFLKENYRRLLEVIDIAKGLRVDLVAFDFLTFLTPKEFKAHKDFFREKFADHEFKSLIYVQEYLDSDLGSLPGIVRDVWNYAKKRKVKIFFKPDLEDKESEIWFNSQFSFRRRCIYPWGVLRISPYGDVYPCAQFYIKLGNIRESSLEEIWNGKKFCDFRKLLKKEKLFPGCNRCIKL